ncbi:hypothetical protein BX616_003610, partial [Lobosporangium transversale]
AFSLDGQKKHQAALAHTPPVPSYLPGLDDDDDDDDDDDGDEDEDRDGRDPDEWQDSEEEGSKAEHGKFTKLRAEHYNMREALKLGHDLVDDDDEEEEEEEEEEETRARRG